MSPKSVEPLPSTSPSGVPQEDKAAKMSPKSTLPLSSRSSGQAGGGGGASENSRIAWVALN